jgi:hypothetical protein
LDNRAVHGKLPAQEKPMNGRTLRIIVLSSFALAAALGEAWTAHAQDVKAPYPNMAPLDQYLMADRNEEIKLARSAAPESISRDAEVVVLGRHGYETAVTGKNGFVCIVERSWAMDSDDPEFWNPKMRGPICHNAPAARFNVALMKRKTELVLAGRTPAQVSEGIDAAFDKKELPPLEAGAMCYMLSKQGYLNDRGGHWHPHIMFFAPLTEPATWGAGLPGSPILGMKDTANRLTVFMIPVAKWSDGTADTIDGH